MNNNELTDAFNLALKITKDEQSDSLTPPAGRFIAYLSGIMDAKNQTAILDILAQVNQIDLDWRHNERSKQRG